MPLKRVRMEINYIGTYTNIKIEMQNNCVSKQSVKEKKTENV